MQDESLKIDVGEANEQETEIDLEAEPKQEEPKEEIVVQETKEDDVVAEQPKAEESKDELSEYSETVKKRIAKLTRKMREAERQKEEAIKFAEKQKSEAEELRKRYTTLDTSYTEEFEKRVTTNVDAAKVKLANAIAAGNIEEQVAAQTEIAQLAMDANRLAKLKDVQTAAPAEKPAEQPAAPATPKVDPRADEWAQKNPWFGSDNAMTYTAFDIHKKLVEEEGFDPSSDEYYSEVDKRIRLEFPHKFDNVTQSTEQPAQNVASAKRPAAKGRRKTVKLTPSQVAISKRLGGPL